MEEILLVTDGKTLNQLSKCTGIQKDTSQNNQENKISPLLGKNTLMISIWKLYYQKQMAKR